jgi:hypothetical protein
MYVGLYVGANRDQNQFDEPNPYARDNDTGLFRRLWSWLRSLFAPVRD